MYSAGLQAWLEDAGYQKRTSNSRWVPLARNGSFRPESTKFRTLVPMVLEPVVLGTAVVAEVAKADRAAGMFRVVTHLCF